MTDVSEIMLTQMERDRFREWLTQEFMHHSRTPNGIGTKIEIGKAILTIFTLLDAVDAMEEAHTLHQQGKI